MKTESAMMKPPDQVAYKSAAASNGFQLCGLGDAELENAVCEAVKRMGYSARELSDARSPAQYSAYDSIFGSGELEHKFLHLYEIDAFMPDFAIAGNSANVKALVKKKITKFFMKVAAHAIKCQTRFNQRLAILLYDFAREFKAHEKTVRELQEEVSELKRKMKNV